MNKIINKLLELYISPLSAIASAGHIEYIMDLICKKMENAQFYTSFRIRPKDIDSMYKKEICNGKKTAILMQGPIYEIDNMTINSVKFYKTIYPAVTIIVSTWKDENEKTLELLRKLGVYVVQSEKPKTSGILNVNYQIVSSKSGVNKARELGVEYVAKTRTDQRICKLNVLYMLQALIDTFAIPDNTKLNGRIVITPSYYGNMFTPYFVSDFFYFGKTDDLNKLFDIALDNRKPFSMQVGATRKKYSELMYPPEIYIMKNFLRNTLNQPCTDTIKEYWQCLRDYFICVDRCMVDLFSIKYSYSRMEHVNDSEYLKSDSIERMSTMNFGFANWLNLYSGTIEYKEEYERETEVQFT